MGGLIGEGPNIVAILPIKYNRPKESEPV